MMKRNLSLFHLVIVAIFLIMAPGKAHADVSYSTLTNYQLATGNGVDKSTRLNAHDRAAIEHEIKPGVPPICVAVINNSNIDIFVPWASDAEWADFLTAVNTGKLPGVTTASCCAPLNATVCGGPAYFPGTSTPIPLGYRFLATPMSNESSYSVVTNGVSTTYLGSPGHPSTPTYSGISSVNNWGAATDVMGPISAPAPASFQITYACSAAGAWVETFEQGSCTPTNGYCNSTVNGQYVANFPTNSADYSNTICAPGSTYASGSLVTTSTGWTWQCNGTTGMTNASCTAYSQPPTNGICGTLSGATTSTFTLEQLEGYESVAPDQICQSGTFSGTFNNNGDASRYYKWTCLGTNGGNSSGTCEVLSANVNGICGSQNGTTTATQNLTSTSTGLCSKGTVENFGYNAVSNQWTWICESTGSGTSSGTCTETYNPNYAIGLCGSASGGTFADGTLSPNNPALCSIGSVTNFSGSSSNSPYWTWYCQGNGGATGNWCSASDVASVAPSCGSVANTVQSDLSAASGNLCATGVLQYFSSGNTGQYWKWDCQGAGNDYGETAWCGAFDNSSLNTATCGSANGTSTTSAPTSGLCGQGSPSGVSENPGDTQWNWSCISADQTESVNCAANVQPPLANGVCGPTNGMTTDAVNDNLCSSGTPSAVTGQGPWTWTCLGVSGGTDSGQCGAAYCQACEGTTTRAMSSGRTGTVLGTCNISGTASWTETDNLVSSATNAATVLWADAAGTFSYTEPGGITAPSPTWCSPCYEQAASVSNAKTVVSATSGTCIGVGVGSSIPAIAPTVH